jgi:hypothetical protein
LRVFCLVCGAPAAHLDTRLVEREVQADATRTRFTRIVRCSKGCDGEHGQREQEVKIVVIDRGPTRRRSVARDFSWRHRSKSASPPTGATG